MSEPEFKKLYRVRQARVFDLKVPCTGRLYGRLAEWPTHLQDKVYEAMEKCMAKHSLKEVQVIGAYTQPISGGLYQAVVTIAEKLTADDVRVTIQ